MIIHGTQEKDTNVTNRTGNAEWTLPVTLNVSVNFTEVASYTEGVDVSLELPIITPSGRFVSKIACHTRPTGRSDSPVVVDRDTCNIALEMVLMCDVHKRIEYILDAVVSLSANDQSRYTQDALESAIKRRINEILSLRHKCEYPVSRGIFSFDTYNVGLTPSTSGTTRINASGDVILCCQRIISALKDISKEINHLSEGIQLSLHVPSPHEYQQTMTIQLLKLLDADARRHQFSTVQRLLRNAGFDPGEIDGNGGPRTEKAAARFRESTALEGDFRPDHPVFRLALSQYTASQLLPPP
jgi:hypothetical protein